MKKTFIALALISLFFNCCVSKKKYPDLEAKNEETQELLNSTIQKLNETLSEKERLLFENESLKQKNQELINNSIENSPILGSPLEMPAYVKYFQQLNPTKSIKLNNYFKRGIPLKECNNKLVNILTEKLKISDGNYKYFSINENSYAIITKKECINKDGTSINKEICKPEKKCKILEFSCVEEGYSRFYLILVTTKILGTPLDFNEEIFKKVYETDELDSNWYSIDEIKQLFKNNKKLTEEYSIIIKLFEIKKDGPMGDGQLLADPTYDFDKQINNLFKSSTQ